jgi:hypothetical protein
MEIKEEESFEVKIEKKLKIAFEQLEEEQGTNFLLIIILCDA